MDFNFSFLFNLVGVFEEKLVKLREIMGFWVEVDFVVLSNFFNISLGEDFLVRVVVIFNVFWGVNFKYGIWAVIV